MYHTCFTFTTEFHSVAQTCLGTYYVAHTLDIYLLQFYSSLLPVLIFIPVMFSLNEYWIELECFRHNECSVFVFFLFVKQDNSDGPFYEGLGANSSQSWKICSQMHCDIQVPGNEGLPGQGLCWEGKRLFTGRDWRHNDRLLWIMMKIMITMAVRMFICVCTVICSLCRWLQRCGCGFDSWESSQGTWQIIIC